MVNIKHDTLRNLSYGTYQVYDGKTEPKQQNYEGLPALVSAQGVHTDCRKHW